MSRGRLVVVDGDVELGFVGERRERLAELDEIIASAPPDCRTVISELATGQLSLDDAGELLRATLEQQDARRAWIIEHWPHIVEHRELTRAVARPTATTTRTVDTGLDITD